MSRCVGPHGRNSLKLTLSDALRVEKKIWILTTVGKTCGLCKQYPWDFLKFVGQFLICRRGNPAFCTAQHSTKSFCRGWHSFGVWINVLVWINRVLMLFWGTFLFYVCLNYPPVLSFTCFPTMILNLEQCISGVKSGRYHMEPHKIQGDF